MSAGKKRVCDYCGAEYRELDSDQICCPDCRAEALLLARKRMRRCHDCGKPTYDYRCRKCWQKLRLSEKSDTGWEASEYGSIDAANF